MLVSGLSLATPDTLGQSNIVVAAIAWSMKRLTSRQPFLDLGISILPQTAALIVPAST